ncbi:cobalamin B12-binding domain-containing protein [Metabacillus sp. GX 13764]|uniref:cobalamin B12-binding domain-containing protein n=1 Tax=Metabacillus kandeliae TaxID=2900151 RepID=UPI001E44B7CE|nr:cobalamin B12-binding domain-containing protein [Metabacillus kandeliae]MCD7035176.1 cobalamin B12-binding domain-containing protein [Metabacillus kandeliae]
MKIEAEKLGELLLSGKVNSAWQYLNEKTSQETFSSSFYEVIREAMYYIGVQWEENAITVADEHVASQVCKNLLVYKQHLNARQHHYNQKSGIRKAMFFCVEGEQHDLGIQIVSNIFEEYGWQTKCLGADLPLEHAVSYAQKYRPEIIGISANIAYYLPLISNYIEELEKLDFYPTIMVGGRLAANYDLEFHCPPNVMIIQDLRQLEDLIKKTGTVQHGNAISG